MGVSTEFYEDDDDVKYIEVEGKMEVQFPLEEMDAHAEGLKGETNENVIQGLAGMAMEVSLAFMEELYPEMLEALADHYNITPPESLKEEYSTLATDLLPELMLPLTKTDLEED